jgi:hypothetical protein
MESERLLSVLDIATPPSAALASAMSDDARRRKWERTSRHIVKEAQDKVALERPSQAVPETLHRPAHVDPTPG